MIDVSDLTPDAPPFAEALTTMRLPRPRPVHPAIVAARATIAEALQSTLRVPDEALPAAWRWRGQDELVEVRYGLYRLYEILEDATVAATRAMNRLGARQAEAGLILGQATLARWDLHGLLLPLETSDLDRPPGGDEWTLRETLGHVALTQSRYTLNTAFWAFAAPTLDGTPPELPDTPLTLPNVAAWSAGTLLDILRRLDLMLDLSVGLLSDVDDGPNIVWMTVCDFQNALDRLRANRQVSGRESLLDEPCEVGWIDRP